MSDDPTPTPGLASAFEAIKRNLMDAREGLEDLPRIARAEMRANRSGHTPRATSPSPAEAETAEVPSDTAPGKPGFAAFDDAVQDRVHELSATAADSLGILNSLPHNRKRQDGE